MTQSTARAKLATVTCAAAGFAIACMAEPGSPANGSGGAPGGDAGAADGGGAGSGGTTNGSGGARAPGTGGLSGGASGGAPGIGGSSGPGGSGGSSMPGSGGAAAPGTGGAAGSGATTRGCDWANPEGRIVLFDGSTLDGWQNTTTGGAAHWRIDNDGTLLVVPANPRTNLQTKMTFDDLCLHVEYVTGGNSGIYLRRAYEMQVLDSYGQQPSMGGCGSVYNVSPPLEVACAMQGAWNTYEIEFRASRWDNAGRKTSNASFVHVTLNGKVVQQNVELRVSNTAEGEPDAAGPQPLMLQDHGNPVRFRNIWAKVPRY